MRLVYNPECFLNVPTNKYIPHEEVGIHGLIVVNEGGIAGAGKRQEMKFDTLEPDPQTSSTSTVNRRQAGGKVSPVWFREGALSRSMIITTPKSSRAEPMEVMGTSGVGYLEAHSRDRNFAQQKKPRQTVGRHLDYRQTVGWCPPDGQQS